MLVSSFRIGKFALQNIWRNFWLSVITVSMLVMTLLTINILLVLNVVTEQAIDFVEDRVEVSVYFEETTKDETIDEAVEYLRALSQVRDVETISAEEACEQFSERHANDEKIIQSLEELGDNPFGPTLIIKANTAADFDVILEALDNPRFADEIREEDFSDYESIIETIQTTTSRIQSFGLTLTAIFLLIAILIVFNTVRIGIFIHREEIGIMRLVGASNWFIKAPFLLEMILISLIATAIMAGIAFPILGILEPKFGLYFGTESAGIIDYFTNNALMIFGGQFAALVVITLFSTILAMRKYLRV